MASPWAPAGQFTAHNVVLPDGTHTLPGEPPLATSVICQVALSALGLALRPCCRHPGTGICMCDCHDMPAPTVADLGCLEGGYAAAFAQAGYDVTGIEARATNYACAKRVKDALGLPNLNFELADVRTALPGRSFDAVFCCGLLYHLDQPAAFVRLLGQVTPLLILNTHYSLTGGAENEGYQGHWYGDNLGDRWSSWGNSQSFWPTEDELRRMLKDAGFHDVRRVDGGTTHDRGMWVAGR